MSSARHCMNDGFFPATSMPDAGWWQALWPDPEKVVAQMGVRRVMVVIDLCCGDGLFTAPLARIAKRVYAIDIDPGLLNQARQHLSSLKMSNCEFFLGDAMKLDKLAPEPVDYVFLANTFHGVPDQLGLARAVAAILKPSGQFGIVNWHRLPREETVVLDQPRGPPTALRMEAEDVIEIVKAAGFKLTEIVELPPYHYGVILGRRDA